MPSYPADKDVSLIVADDIRHEVGNKIGIAGWYVGDDILIPTANAMVPALAFLFIARGGEGDFEWTVEIKAPNGPPGPSFPKNPIKLEHGAPFVQAIKIFNMPLFPGTYAVTLLLNDRRYEHSFSVKVFPSA